MRPASPYRDTYTIPAPTCPLLGLIAALRPSSGSLAPMLLKVMGESRICPPDGRSDIAAAKFMTGPSYIRVSVNSWGSIKVGIPTSAARGQLQLGLMTWTHSAGIIQQPGPSMSSKCIIHNDICVLRQPYWGMTDWFLRQCHWVARKVQDALSGCCYWPRPGPMDNASYFCTSCSSQDKQTNRTLPVVIAILTRRPLNTSSPGLVLSSMLL